MTAESGRRISLGFWLAMAGLLAAPIMAPPATAAPQGDQERQEREQEWLDREQEKRDHEQELRDREQEKREREQERADRQTELYDDGQEALDEARWEQAEAKFGQLAEMNGPQSDAALYWKSYAQSHAGKRDSALASLAELNRRFPQSRWAKDAKALDIEVRQSSGQLVQAEGESDCELKMLAMQGAMNGDPEKAMPILEKFIGGSASPRCKKKALF